MPVHPLGELRHGQIRIKGGPAIVTAETLRHCTRLTDFLSIQKHDRTASVQKLERCQRAAGFCRAKPASTRIRATYNSRSHAAFVVVLNVIDQMRAQAVRYCYHFAIVIIDTAIRINAFKGVVRLVMIDGVESGLDQLSLTLNRVTAAYEVIGLREEVSGAAFTSLSDQESPSFRGCVVCEIASEAVDAFGLPVGEDGVDAGPGAGP